MLDHPAIWTPADLDAHDYGLLCAYTHPDCDVAELTLLADWYVWAFFFGDHFLRTYKKPRDLAGAKAHLDRLRTFLADGAPEPANPVERGLADLWPRTACSRSRDWRERFAGSTRDLLDGAMWELRCIDTDRIPNPLEYVRMRRQAGGAPWVAHLAEHALSAELPGRLAGERPLRMVADTFADAVHLRNDIFSYQRETELEGELANGVLVLEEFLGMSPQEAADTTNDIITSRQHQFDDTVLTGLPVLYADHAATAAEQAAIAAYVRGLRDWEAGCHEWHLRSSRYPKATASRSYGPSGLGTTTTRRFPPHRGGTGGPCTPGYPFRLPTFVMPWKAVANRHLDSARRYAKAWAYEMGMIGPLAVRGDGVWTDTRYDSLELVLFAALTQPVAERDRLHLLSLWDVWAFALDDYFLAEFKARRDLAGARAFVAGLRRFMTEHAPPPANCVERGLADLWARTAPGLAAGVRERFPAHVMAFAEGNLWELGNTLRDHIPDPVDYVEMRRQTAGTDLSTHLGFLTSWGEISPELLDTRQLRDLIAAFADNVDFRNDIFSYRKEIELEFDVNNGVLVIQDFFKCGLQHAVEIAGDIMTASLREFQRITEEDLPLMLEELDLAPAVRDRVLTFVRGLERWLSGDLAWYTRTRRYTGADRPARTVMRPTGPGTSASRSLRDTRGHTARP
jgi:germacradienol/geosmin synthase